MKHFLYLICLVITATACQKEAIEPHILRGQALGTTYQVSYFAENSFDAETKFDSVVEAVNQSMSTYRPNSAISGINRGDTTIVVDVMFQEVLTTSQEIYKKSNGYFDPTVGILVNAYGFGPEKPLNHISEAQLDSLKKYVGLDKVMLLPSNRIKKSYPEVYLDFNSIAKGYCIDRIGLMLEQNGVENYLIEMGGELLAKGTNLQKLKPWTVGIENIDAPVSDRSYTQAVQLGDRGMAGSGNYRKYRVDAVTGKRFVHTINPLTGKAEKSDVLSATVVANTCAIADAYATTFMAMGLERSKNLLKTLEGVDAYLLVATPDSSAVFVSEGFKKYLKE